MNNPDSDYDEDIYTEELVLPLNETDRLLYEHSSYRLLQEETPKLITDNSSNIISPKFIRENCFFSTDNEYLYSIPNQVFIVKAILKSETDNSIFITIGSGVIVFTAIDFYHAFITSQTLHPPEYRNHKLEIISIKASILGTYYDCSIIDEGNYVPNYSSENDWALLKINIDMNTNFHIPIPRPSIRKSLSQYSVGSEFPEEYNTLLFGYFTKNETVEHESGRVKELGLEISDVWKIVPKNQMSGSLGWICNSAQSGDFYNCGSTNSCSGGPVFQCSLNIEEVLRAEEQDKQQKRSSNTFSLLNNTKFENILIGIHCGGHKDGNVFCSVDNFFESYFKNVYSPHKKYFSQSEIQLIENEWKLFNSKDETPITDSE